MKITKENYEMYFIDYLDGNLSDQEVRLLENFLLLNPSYRNELEGLESIILTPEDNSFPEKDSLRQVDISLPINAYNFDDFCVADIEGDLSENLKTSFHNYLGIHPEKLNDYLIYNQIHLAPDKNSVFQFKNELKKSVVILNRKILYSAISMAAAVALIFIIVKQSGESDSGLGKKITADLPIKTENPLKISQNTNKEKGDITAIKEIPVRKKPVLKQTATIPIPVINEKTSEISIPALDEKKPVETNKPDLLAKYNPALEIKIPVLIENDVTIPKTIYDIQSKETNVNNSSEKYLSLVEFARKRLNEKVLGKKDNNISRVSFFDIAGAGINGINLLAGSKMKLEKKTNTKGEPEMLAFESRLFSFSTSVNFKK